MGNKHMKGRFRGYFPVVIDVETAGFSSKTDALLEICAVTLKMDSYGYFSPMNMIHFHILPFEGANLEKRSLKFNGIQDPFSLLRGAVSESKALKETYRKIQKEQREAGCKRAVLVAHNASFDFSFIQAANRRTKIKHIPFHPFLTFDTATLSGLAYGQTVLAKACQVARIDFDSTKSHSALYDASKTAELFCKIVNQWHDLGGWPLRDDKELDKEN